MSIKNRAAVSGWQPVTMASICTEDTQLLYNFRVWNDYKATKSMGAFVQFMTG